MSAMSDMPKYLVAVLLLSFISHDLHHLPNRLCGETVFSATAFQGQEWTLTPDVAGWCWEWMVFLYVCLTVCNRIKCFREIQLIFKLNGRIFPVPPRATNSNSLFPQITCKSKFRGFAVRWDVGRKDVLLSCCHQLLLIIAISPSVFIRRPVSLTTILCQMCFMKCVCLCLCAAWCTGAAAERKHQTWTPFCREGKNNQVRQEIPSIVMVNTHTLTVFVCCVLLTRFLSDNK